MLAGMEVAGLGFDPWLLQRHGEVARGHMQRIEQQVRNVCLYSSHYVVHVDLCGTARWHAATWIASSSSWVVNYFLPSVPNAPMENSCWKLIDA